MKEALKEINNLKAKMGDIIFLDEDEEEEEDDFNDKEFKEKKLNNKY